MCASEMHVSLTHLFSIVKLVFPGSVQVPDPKIMLSAYLDSINGLLLSFLFLLYGSYKTFNT